MTSIGSVHSGQRVLVAVCTYNEASNVDPLLTRIKDAAPEADILVVDDDSPDGTADRAGEFDSESGQRVRVIVRQNQRGLGGAILVAMQYAIENQYEWFVNLDADLSHDPAEIPRMLQRTVDSPGTDVVVGSRYVDGGRVDGWPPHRRWMSRLLNGFTSRLLRLPVRDASGSFRCYRVAMLADVVESMVGMRDPSQGYAFLQEVMLDLHQAGATFLEHPITFTDRVAGTSKLSLREATRSASKVARLLTRRPPKSA